jgi:hypothetical protein
MGNGWRDAHHPQLLEPLTLGLCGFQGDAGQRRHLGFEFLAKKHQSPAFVMMGDHAVFHALIEG